MFEEWLKGFQERIYLQEGGGEVSAFFCNDLDGLKRRGEWSIGLRRTSSPRKPNEPT
jgi:hypothetical protein